jgi:hypothetical protein
MRTSLLLRVVMPSAVVGVVCAALNIGAIGPADSSDFEVATATTHYLVDVPDPALIHRLSPPTDLPGLVRRAELLAGLTATPPVIERIGRRAGVPVGQIAASNRTTASVPLALSEPGSERRATDIRESLQRYHVDVQARQTTPVLDVYVQAPTVGEARRLATATAGGLLDYLQSEAQRQGIVREPPIRLKELGPARAGVISGAARPSVGLLTFLLAFGLSCMALFAVTALRRRASGAAFAGGDTDIAAAGGSGPRRWPITDHESQPRHPSREPSVRADDWPRTTRLVPWTIAIFIAVLWLVPFNAIQLNASLPIDLKFDRLILPIVAGAWLLAVLAGGRTAPRIRLTWIHAALAAFVACALLSVVLSARYLNQTGELDLSVKQLPLLIAYVSLFVIVASGVRRSEVSAFLKYTIVLAVVCGVGVIWEYRFKSNPFYNFSNALLPGTFTVADANATALDEIGRRVVRGPAEVGLEAVTMLSLALAIALVGFLDAKRWGPRVAYALAGCIVIAATFATFRKSALLAPVSVVATLAYFRRRHLLKLAPVGLVVIVMVQVLSPGALNSTIAQFFRPDRLAVPTVSDRTSDYDAIRPDLWAHPAFGRGFGSYNHETYRILDSEILHRAVETGVLGLVLFLLIPVAVVATSRVMIASRDRTRAPIALVGAAGGVCFLVVSTLYDVLSFPHATYIFLYIAGLVSVAVARPGEKLLDEVRDTGASVPLPPPPAGADRERLPASEPVAHATAGSPR